MSARRPIPTDRLLAWTYRVQKADLVIDRGIGLFEQERELQGVEPHGRSMEAAVAEIARLGTRVDGGGRAATDCHPDAEVVHHIVSSLADRRQGIRLSALLIGHAKAGTMPARTMVSMPSPVLNVRGKPSVKYAPNDSGRNYGWCPIEWSSGQLISQVEDEWDRWVAGLRLVTLALHHAARLTIWYPTLPDVAIALDDAKQSG